MGNFAKQPPGQADSIQLRRPASSVEADIVDSSTCNSQSLLEESSTASSKNYTFKTGGFTMSLSYVTFLGEVVRLCLLSFNVIFYIISFCVTSVRYDADFLME